MARIELPNSSEKMRHIVDRFGPTATLIALNQVRTARLDDFISTYTLPESDDITVNVDGRLEVYRQKGISAVTANGTMVHARLHESPHLVRSRAVEYLTVIDSVYGDEPTEFWTASSAMREIGYSGVSETIIDAISQLNIGLRAVEDEAEIDDDLQLLDQALAPEFAPQLRYGGTGWRYRSGLETYETMHDIHDVQRKVQAIRAELGAGAIRAVAGTTEYDLRPTGSDK